MVRRTRKCPHEYQGQGPGPNSVRPVWPWTGHLTSLSLSCLTCGSCRQHLQEESEEPASGVRQPGIWAGGVGGPALGTLEAPVALFPKGPSGRWGMGSQVPGGPQQLASEFCGLPRPLQPWAGGLGLPSGCAERWASRCPGAPAPTSSLPAVSDSCPPSLSSPLPPTDSC